jgi:hypothetical protein
VDYRRSGRAKIETSEERVRDFQLIVADDRKRVADLLLVCVRDETRAREIAERILGESHHHVGVEVLEFGRRLFAVSRTRSRSPLAELPATA